MKAIGISPALYVSNELGYISLEIQAIIGNNIKWTTNVFARGSFISRSALLAESPSHTRCSLGVHLPNTHGNLISERYYCSSISIGTGIVFFKVYLFISQLVISQWLNYQIGYRVPLPAVELSRQVIISSRDIVCRSKLVLGCKNNSENCDKP